MEKKIRMLDKLKTRDRNDRDINIMYQEYWVCDDIANEEKRKSEISV